VDEDLREGFSTVVYSPGPNAAGHECVVPTLRIDGPEGYKQATERYSHQVSLDVNGVIQ
jgi:hypothetical protein